MTEREPLAMSDSFPRAVITSLLSLNAVGIQETFMLSLLTGLFAPTTTTSRVQTCSDNVSTAALLGVDWREKNSHVLAQTPSLYARFYDLYVSISLIVSHTRVVENPRRNGRRVCTRFSTWAVNTNLQLEEKGARSVVDHAGHEADYHRPLRHNNRAPAPCIHFRNRQRT